MFETRPLHPRFGVEVLGVDAREIRADHLYPELRDLFERHSVLVLRDQTLSADEHVAFARLFGPLEDRSTADGTEGADFAPPAVSNRRAAGDVADDAALQQLNLEANQLWHTDSTFLPTPALANILIARAVASTGGATELASSRAAWRDMPADLRAAAEQAIVWHRYAHSRAKVSKELSGLDLFTKWPDQPRPALWRNPVTGERAVYIASHACRVEGMDPDSGTALIDRLIAFCTQPQYVYSHPWRVGDLMIFDERATLHRGTPWPMEEERTLSSICVSASAADGLETIDIAA